MKLALDKKYVYQLCLTYIISGFFIWLFTVLPIAIGMMSVSVVLGLLTLLLVPVVYVAIVYGISFLWWKNYTYELQPESFVKHFGIISLRNTNIPYERIQNININRPLISRMFGLSQLHIQTAGNSGAIGAEGRLPGLSADIAEKLRDELIHRSKGLPVASQQHGTPTTDHSGGL